MRNTLMQDKLAALFVPQGSPQLDRRTELLIAGAAKRAKRDQLRKPALTIRNPASVKNPYQSLVAPEPSATSPRYITPPKKKNPFSVHVYPVQTAPEPEIEEQKEIPESKASVAPVVKETKIEETKDETPAAVSTPLPVLSPVAEQAVTKPKSIVIIPAPTAHKAIELPAATESSLPEVSEPVEETEEVETSTNDSKIQEDSSVEPSPSENTPVVEPAAQEEETPAVIALPQNLKWLEHVTPFGDQLRAMVEKLRTAKTNVVFTLEQSTKRQEDLKKQIAALNDALYKEEFVGEQQKEYLRQVDETIAACALVAEQSSSIESILHSAPASTHKTHSSSTGSTEKRSYRRFDSVHTLHREDVLKIFVANPGRKWNNAEILSELPQAKREHGKSYLYALLSTLTKEGTIQRIAPGIYINGK